MGQSHQWISIHKTVFGGCVLTSFVGEVVLSFIEDILSTTSPTNMAMKDETQLLALSELAGLQKMLYK